MTEDRTGIAKLAPSLIALGTLALCVSSAGAQINRSRPPSPPPSSGGSGNRGSSSPPPRSYGGSTPRSSSSSSTSRSDGGRTPSVSPGIGSASGNPREGQKPLDRYNKSNEAAAARGSSGRPHVFYSPIIYPFGYYPDAYVPGGYPPYPYPYPYPYPSPDPYPVPRGDSQLAARYDSPYYFCDDLSGAKYVSGGTVIISKPKHLYTPIPVYRDSELDRWRDLGADNYLAARNVENKEYVGSETAADDAALDEAITDIRRSWIDGDIAPLADHVSKDGKIAVVLSGKYIYSLESGDFLGVTKAAYESANRLRFVLDHLHRRDDGVYALTGRHLFTDNSGKERAAYFTYILTKERSGYMITQIASAPDRE